MTSTSTKTGNAIIGTEAQKSDPENPTQLRRPAFLLNVPFSLSTEVANNAWMEDYENEDARRPEKGRAMSQFLELYRFLAADGLVYLLPTPRAQGLQDLVFTANLGIVFEHIEGQRTVVISNFTSEPRRGESPVGVDFFAAMGYSVYVPPHRFEGEAELKHLHDNVYIGGYGYRSEPEAYDWMADEFGIKIIKVRERDPYLYHLDCSIFPLTKEDTLVCTALFEPHELAAISRHTNVIDVSVDDCYQGICNSVRDHNIILNSSRIHELPRNSEDYKRERHKNNTLEDIASEYAFEVAYFNLSEYEKSGALLSCMVMHLNRYSYAFNLL
jgi:N-dimethylarginine dimethylaminohydrolase